jgi:hypothetical protein
MASSDSSSEAGSVSLTREAIVGAFAALDRELEARGATAEICLFDGTVMVLAFAARASTKDADAIFQPAALVRELARRVAESFGLPADWLNDGVKAWISALPSAGMRAVLLLESPGPFRSRNLFVSANALNRA